MATIAIMEKNSLNINLHRNENLQPIISFGLITDIHYANNDDRWNYSNTFLRRYRNSLNLVDQACNHWLNGIYPIAFIIQLGDLIDGCCYTNKTSINDLKIILEQFRNISSIYHIWGNHELYNFTRNELLNGPLCSFDTKNIYPGHYGTFKVSPNLRIIAIDTYELSLLGIDKNNTLYIQSMNLLRKYNQNENINDPTGLDGYQQRFIQLNGGLTQKQLIWLKEQLLQAKHLHEKVIIVGHIPIHPKACDELALLWNYEDVLDILWTFDNNILAYIAGHSHEGAYFYDEKNIHHLTFQAIVECEPDTNAFATVHVYKEYLIIEGVGRIGTYRIDFNKFK
ncbi:unnamed protein product [Rotaria sordida]|uniref:Calcineurin-like phosphoesterase domain-containing protein n=1 Tax=Rotaria sordida TaxID=392033 RepID=A0A813XVV4_9BILA|nr:unnamed protein product [Rotaria sordida]CAF0907816.1 unnamed protein product [Rotaria sordida]CAF3664395.1 unnamed protein product [Rotaria sordida]CAF4089818.1 unnamed protein product [Rotaria sordida]